MIFLSMIAEFVDAAANASGAKLVDVRRNQERDVANRVGHSRRVSSGAYRWPGLRRGKDARGRRIDPRPLGSRMFRPSSLPPDKRASSWKATDVRSIALSPTFVSGAVEKLILANQHHDILMIEGQGVLAHPRYSAVTLGLASWLHAPRHDSLLRSGTRRRSTAWITLASRVCRSCVTVYETMANLMGPSEVIGVAMNSRRLTDDEAEARTSTRTMRNGASRLRCDSAWTARTGQGRVGSATPPRRGRGVDATADRFTDRCATFGAAIGLAVRWV